MRRMILAVGCAVAALGQAPAQTFSNQAAELLGGAGFNARSASLADIDNDGDLDLLFQGGNGARQLFRNNLIEERSLSFTNITTAQGLVVPGVTGWSAAWADYDGDGRVDVFLGQNNLNSGIGALFRNTVTGFVNVSATTIPDPGWHQNVAWVDANRDGMLDLMIAMEGPQLHELYLQNPESGFTAVGAASGIQVPYGTKAYGMAIGDVDGDGDMDMYVSTCISGGNIRNNFFDNRLVPDGTLFYNDIADDNGTQFMDNSYHAEFMDVDDDGDLDLFMIGADAQETKLWLNNMDGTWTDVASIKGGPLLPHPGGDLNGGKLIDYDNDGDLDIFGHDHLAANGRNDARMLFRNDGNWNFVDVTTAEGIANTNEGAYDSTWGDLDRDGDMDLIAATDNRAPERIFISNASTNGNRWLQVILRDPLGKNTRAIGSQIYLTVGDRTWRRDANTNAGTFNQSDIPIHFGLGEAETITRLEVRWPDGTETVLENVDVDQYLTIVKAPPPQDEGLGVY